MNSVEIIRNSMACECKARPAAPPTSACLPACPPQPLLLLLLLRSSAGALAGFAAATEFTFGSIVQRIMTWPGCVRFHCEQGLQGWRETMC